MTEIQNPKQLVLGLIWDLDIVTWNLFGPILRSGVACNLLFPVYPDLGPYIATRKHPILLRRQHRGKSIAIQIKGLQIFDTG